MKFLFYCLEPHELSFRDEISLSDDYSFALWKPTWFQIIPNGVPLMPFSIWWLFHHVHMFSNQDYGMALIYQHSALVHRSCIFPGYFRFPFMGKEDLQIGDTWTHPNYRGRGLAKFALQRIVELYNRSGRKLWYIVEENNLPSIKVVEKVGFTLVGKGERRKRFGSRLFGAYVMREVVENLEN